MQLPFKRRDRCNNYDRLYLNTSFLKHKFSAIKDIENRITMAMLLLICAAT